MRRAIAFCRDIRSSELIAREFGKVVDEFNEVEGIEEGSADKLPSEACRWYF